VRIVLRDPDFRDLQRIIFTDGSSKVTAENEPSAKIGQLDFWRLNDELTVVQAALLIVGEDPSDHPRILKAESNSGKSPSGFGPTMSALKGAIEKSELPARVLAFDDPYETNWDRTWVSVEDLRSWLRRRGITTGFFFPTPETHADYLLQSHPCFSAKLAAAVEAWKAVSGDPKLRRRKSVKQALIVWLRQHFKEFGLTKEDGNPNEQGIEEVAKIANWDTRGGAPKSPGSE
jgi:hypothetical protein